MDNEVNDLDDQIFDEDLLSDWLTNNIARFRYLSDDDGYDEIDDEALVEAACDKFDQPNDDGVFVNYVLNWLDQYNDASDIQHYD